MLLQNIAATVNPQLALPAGVDECIQAGRRIAAFCNKLWLEAPCMNCNN